MLKQLTFHGSRCVCIKVCVWCISASIEPATLPKTSIKTEKCKQTNVKRGGLRNVNSATVVALK